MSIIGHLLTEHLHNSQRKVWDVLPRGPALMSASRCFAFKIKMSSIWITPSVFFFSFFFLKVRVKRFLDVSAAGSLFSLADGTYSTVACWTLQAGTATSFFCFFNYSEASSKVGTTASKCSLIFAMAQFSLQIFKFAWVFWGNENLLVCNGYFTSTQEFWSIYMSFYLSVYLSIYLYILLWTGKSKCRHEYSNMLLRIHKWYNI